MNMTVENMPPPVREYFHRRMLTTHTPNYVYSFGAMRENMPANEGDFIKFGRMRRLPPALQPLGDDGAPIPPVTTNRTDISGKIQIFAQWIGVNQRITMSNQDRVLENLSDLLGISLRETEDKLLQDLCLSSASFINAVGGNNGDVPSNISESDVDALTSMLLSNDAMMLLEQAGGEDRFGTAPINDSFIGLCHTNMVPSLNATPGFTKKANYSNPHAAIKRSEWGTISNVRVFISSVGPKLLNASALGNTVYPVTIMGAEALAVVNQDNFSSELLYRPAWVSDPVGQNATLSWSSAMANVITDESWLMNLYCTL